MLRSKRISSVLSHLIRGGALIARAAWAKLITGSAPGALAVNKVAIGAAGHVRASLTICRGLSMRISLGGLGPGNRFRRLRLHGIALPFFSLQRRIIQPLLRPIFLV